MRILTKFSLESKGMCLGIVAGFAAVGIAFAAGEMIQRRASAASPAVGPLVIPSSGTAAREGYNLFMLNCAHCHGADARGDEGPDLHGLTKSDQRLRSIIQNGIKGEMPKFNAKLSDTDTRSLVIFLRSLGDD